MKGFVLRQSLNFTSLLQLVPHATLSCGHFSINILWETRTARTLQRRRSILHVSIAFICISKCTYMTIACICISKCTYMTMSKCIIIIIIRKHDLKLNCRIFMHTQKLHFSTRIPLWTDFTIYGYLLIPMVNKKTTYCPR